jgi:hypothetical protein
MTRISIPTYIETLVAATQSAGLSYEIWIACRSKENIEDFNKALKRHPVFVPMLSHVNFVAMMISLYALYETRKDTLNIRQLLKQLSKNPNFAVASLDKAQKLREEALPIWEKVSMLRNNALGHFSASLQYEEAFQKAGLQPREIEKLIAISKKLLNVISTEAVGSSHAFNIGAKESTKKALQQLSGRK